MSRKLFARRSTAAICMCIKTHQTTPVSSFTPGWSDTFVGSGGGDGGEYGTGGLSRRSTPTSAQAAGPPLDDDVSG